MYYKYENEQLMWGDYVQFPDGSFLHMDFLDTYSFPVNDWYYFPTIELARTFWNIPDPLAEPETETTQP